VVVTGFVCVFELGVIDEQPSERAITAAKMAAFPVSAARSARGPCHFGRDKRGLSRCGSSGHPHDVRFLKMRCRIRAAYMVE
jgi:hypothetical protein